MVDLILVDEDDKQIGTDEKLSAHENGGKLHRAISVCVFNSKGELLLQQRAATKYHAKSQWANTVCSHPYPNESSDAAAHRRLKEELGFDCTLKEAFTFIYKSDVGSGLTEHEFDHVFFGRYDGEPAPDPKEVQDWEYVPLKDIREELKTQPSKYAPWFKYILNVSKHRK